MSANDFYKLYKELDRVLVDLYAMDDMEDAEKSDEFHFLVEKRESLFTSLRSHWLWPMREKVISFMDEQSQTSIA